ncbi:MAG TPA: UvrD-helicase domain-containing protein [Polyangiaceae bacterium]|nr:UvrD-helicase domain-containing protein [Polyangiaceae bacterium]
MQKLVSTLESATQGVTIAPPVTSAKAMLASLNAPQKEAVCTLKGPLLVLAGAGSGKTRVITYRIARLIAAGVAPERILAVTFTNKAAKEMKARAAVLLGKGKRKAPEISTFHSLCVRILRRHIDRLGYPKQFSIFDQGDQDSIARSALRDIRVGHEKLKPGDLLWHIGQWKSAQLTPEQALEQAKTDKEQLAAMAFARYQAALRTCGAVDFDDLLSCTQELFERFADVRKAEQQRFVHLLIDEYQDTNALQYRIVTALAERHRNLCVVGDDDQSIYGWRGAEVTHILNFTRDWPEAKVVRLEDNYRSRQSVLELANRLILHNSNRYPKTLQASRTGGDTPRYLRFEDEVQEANSVVKEIVQRVTATDIEKIPAGDIAILFRTNEQPRAFEIELRRAKIPYVLVGGQSFYDRKEVRDILAYLKVIAHPQDEVSLLRIINTPARGIGDTAVRSLLERAIAAGKPLWEILSDPLTLTALPAGVAPRVTAFRERIEQWQERTQKEKLSAVVQDLLGQINYRAELSRVYKNDGDVEARWSSLEELVNSLALYEARAAKPTLAEFLTETVLAGREDQREEEDPRRQNALTLMTLHSAKGLEFRHVYMVGMEEGLLPHQRSVIENRGVEEERRLCYVGVTRAMDTLTLTLSKSRMKWGKAYASIPSRFLLEMRGETDRARLAAEAAEKRFMPKPPGVSEESPKRGARRRAVAAKNNKRGTAKAKISAKSRSPQPA